jgi:hypothetical protein
MTNPTPSECHEGYLSGLHATRPRQHLSGIHPPGGRVAPSAPVVWPIPKPGGIFRYVTRDAPLQTDERIPDERIPDETDSVAGTFGPPEDIRQQTPPPQ